MENGKDPQSRLESDFAGHGGLSEGLARVQEARLGHGVIFRMELTIIRLIK
jgi:hypothetical protein